MRFINDKNIDGTCLDRSRLYLNKRATTPLVKNFCKWQNQHDVVMDAMVRFMIIQMNLQLQSQIGMI